MPDNIPGYGFEEVVHIAQETTFGTQASTGWRSFRCVSFALVKLDPARIRPAASGRPVGLVYAAGTTPGPREIKHLIRCAGRVVIECDWQDLGILLKNALLDTPTQSLTTGVLTSTFESPIVPVAMPQSLTICREVGSTFTAKDQYFVGCYIDTARILIRENEPILAQLDIVGRNMAFGTAPAGDYSTTPWMEYHEHSVRLNTSPGSTPPVIGDVLDGGQEPDSVELVIENRLRIKGAGGQGGRVHRQPIPQGYRRLSMKITRDWSNNALQEAILAEGASGYVNLSLPIISDDNIPGGTPSTPFSLTPHFHAARVVGDPPTAPGGPDIIPETVEFEAAFEAGSSKLATFTLVNGGGATEYNDAT